MKWSYPFVTVLYLELKSCTDFIFLGGSVTRFLGIFSGPLINRLKCLKNLFSRSSIYLYIFGTGKWKASRINTSFYDNLLSLGWFFLLWLLLERVLTILQIRLERERERQDNGTFNGFLCKSSLTMEKETSQSTISVKPFSTPLTLKKQNKLCHQKWYHFGQ